MRTLPVLMAITLTIYVVGIAALAWDITMTWDHPFTGIGGGLLPFGIFTGMPIFFWAIGRYFPRFD